MPVGGARGHDPYDDRGGWSEQRGHPPPPRDHGRRPGPPPGGVPPRKRRRARPVHWFRRIALLLVVLLVAYVAWMAIAINGAFGEINKIDAMPDHSDRPGSADGRNYVLVGSDSREDLSPEDRRRLGTGGAEGARTDSIMLLHIPDGGDPTLMSLPRDLWVPIRDAGEGKINASYAIGGPKLLVDTVEQTTGVPIDGYMEIGFGGFANVVDAVNGVEMCLDEPINDEKAHIDLPAGCQTLDGVNALGYVRMRYSDPRGDLGRAERQREFLGALSKKAATPANLLLPWRVRSVGGDIAKSLTIDDGMGMKETFDVLWAVRKAGSGGRSMLAPVSDEPYRAPNGSIAVQWDEAKKQKVFDAIRNGDDATAFD